MRHLSTAVDVMPTAHGAVISVSVPVKGERTQVSQLPRDTQLVVREESGCISMTGLVFLCGLVR